MKKFPVVSAFQAGKTGHWSFDSVDWSVSKLFNVLQKFKRVLSVDIASDAACAWLVHFIARKEIFETAPKFGLGQTSLLNEIALNR